MAGGARSKSTFPPLNSSEFSQAPVDQQALSAIKKIWDNNSMKWPKNVRQKVLELSKLVKQTASNKKAPSSHKVWKDPEGWNFGHWVIMRVLYDPDKLVNMRHTLREVYPHVDFDSMDGPGLPDSESDNESFVNAHINVKTAKDSNLRKRTTTKSPIRSPSRAADDEGMTRPPLKRSARVDNREKRRRDTVVEDSDDDTSTTSHKRGKSMAIKNEFGIGNEGEHYRRHTPKPFADFGRPGAPPAASYSTGNTGIVDSRYRQMSGDRRASGSYPYPADYRMGVDRQASVGYSHASLDHHAPYLERDLGQRGRMAIAGTPTNEEIEPSAIVRLRQEMNARLQGQEKSHFDEIRGLRAEMQAMRTQFEQQVFEYKRQYEVAIADLANRASLAGHDSM